MNADVLTTKVADGIAVITLGSASRMYFDQQMGAIAHRPRETKEERERRWAELGVINLGQLFCNGSANGGELFIEASDGLDRPSQAVQYRLGEGITGRVVETGKHIVVPRVSREPAMLNRAARRADSSASSSRRRSSPRPRAEAASAIACSTSAISWTIAASSSPRRCSSACARSRAAWQRLWS